MAQPLFEPSNDIYVVGQFPFKIGAFGKTPIVFDTGCTINMIHESIVPSQYWSPLHNEISTIGLADQESKCYYTCEIPIKLGSCSYTLPFIISSAITEQASHYGQLALNKMARKTKTKKIREKQPQIVEGRCRQEMLVQKIFFYKSCNFNTQAFWENAKQEYEVKTLPEAIAYRKAIPNKPSYRKAIEQAIAEFLNTN
jgi:hypothetical protein